VYIYIYIFTAVSICEVFKENHGFEILALALEQALEFRPLAARHSDISLIQDELDRLYVATRGSPCENTHTDVHRVTQYVKCILVIAHEHVHARSHIYSCTHLHVRMHDCLSQ